MTVLIDLLTGEHEPPCLSLYQPTHRSHPQNVQDPIRFRNLVKALAGSLQSRYPAVDAAALLGPFHALAADERFWNHSLDALAVFAASGMFSVQRLQRPVGELALAAEAFQVKPLLRIVQSADRYQILGLSRGGVKLFEGNRDALDEVELDAAVRQVVADAHASERKRGSSAAWTPHAGAAGLGAGAVVHGGIGGDRRAEVERETEKFFRELDRVLLEHYSRPTALPLILAGLREHRAEFLRVSKNPFVLADGIDIHPDAMSRDALRERAWRTIEPHYLARLAALVEMFGAARARKLGSDDLEEVEKSAAAGRVATLLVQAEPMTPATDERLDDLAECVLRERGQVVVVPVARMPVHTGAAAIYRY